MCMPRYKDEPKWVDSESKKKWDAQNTFIYTVKFMRKTDEDVIEFLQGKNRKETICKAVRFYMEHHPDELKGE